MKQFVCMAVLGLLSLPCLAKESLLSPQCEELTDLLDIPERLFARRQRNRQRLASRAGLKRRLEDGHSGNNIPCRNWSLPVIEDCVPDLRVLHLLVANGRRDLSTFPASAVV